MRSDEKSALRELGSLMMSWLPKELKRPSFSNKSQCLNQLFREDPTIALASEQPNRSHLSKGALLHPRYSRARDHVAPAAANRHADFKNGR